MARAHEQPIRITTAAESRRVEQAARQRRYFLAMSIRSICFVGAVLAALGHVAWLWPILIVGALVLPYVAVVMANARNSKGDDFMLQDSPYGRPQLTEHEEDQQ
jgi:Flp pilus assembly protein TadB